MASALGGSAIAQAPAAQRPLAGQQAKTPGDSPLSEVARLPLLPAGCCLALQYNTPSEGQSALVDTLWNAAHQAGLGGMHLALTWQDLEPQPGQIDTAQLEMLLQLVQLAGLRPLLSIATIDTFRLSLPADLVDTTDTRRLAESRTWSDPLLSQRMEKLLGRVLPLLEEYGGFYVSLGNEVDPLLFGSQEKTAQYAEFLGRARVVARKLTPQIALGTTVRFVGLQAHPERFQQLLAACDTVALTYFPMNPDQSVQAPELAEQQLAAMQAALGSRALILQEFGYPSGRSSDSGIGSSQEQQRRFLEVCFESFAQHPNLRFANYAGVVDYGPADLGLLQLHHNSSLPNLVEGLGSLGLAEYASGKPKPAYGVFLQGLKDNAQRQD